MTMRQYTCVAVNVSLLLGMQILALPPGAGTCSFLGWGDSSPSWHLIHHQKLKAAPKTVACKCLL